MNKPGFRTEIAYEKAVSLFGNISDFRAVSGGEESQVFRFASAQRGLVLRINAALEPFEKDRFVFERFARQGLPIPEVFQIGGFGDHFYCVSQEMRGETLQDLPSEQLAQLLVPTCEVWRIIATSDVSGLDGFGPFTSTGVGTYPAWSGFLLDILPRLHRHSEILQAHVELPILTQWEKTFSALVTFCPEEHALVHGDFGSNNVLADHGSITAVLDWSEGMFGDRLYDVANIFFWRTWLPCMEQQASYFESHLPRVPHCAERLLCYELRIAFTELIAVACSGSTEVVFWVLERCRLIAAAATVTLSSQKQQS